MTAALGAAGRLKLVRAYTFVWDFETYAHAMHAETLSSYEMT